MALATAKQIEEIADKFTASANAIHERLMNAIRKKAIDTLTAQALFQNESILRQHANSLYIDAASSILNDITEPQQSVTTLIDAANEEIKKNRDIAHLIDLTADILALAAAIHAARATPVIAALQEIRNDLAP